MSEAGDFANLRHLSEVDRCATNSETSEKTDNICEDGSIITGEGSGDVSESASLTEPQSDPQNDNMCTNIDVAIVQNLVKVVETSTKTCDNTPSVVTKEAIVDELLSDEPQECEEQQDKIQQLKEVIVDELDGDDAAANKPVESHDVNVLVISPEEQFQEPDIIIGASCPEENVQEAQPSETRCDFEDDNNTENDPHPNLVSDQSNSKVVGERDFLSYISNDVVSLTEGGINDVKIVEALEGNTLCDEKLSEKDLKPVCEIACTPNTADGLSNPDSVSDSLESNSGHLSNNETDENKKETAVKADENFEKYSEADIDVISTQTEEASLAYKTDNTEQEIVLIETEILPEDSIREKSISPEKESEPISDRDKNYDSQCGVSGNEPKNEPVDINLPKKESKTTVPKKAEKDLCIDVKGDENPKSLSKDISKERGTPEKVKIAPEKKTQDVKKDISPRTPDKSTKSSKDRVVKEKIVKRDNSEYKVDDDLAKANKSNNSAVRGLPNLNSKPSQSRDTKPPSKQRYSEQRQRKTASRAGDRQEKKDGSTTERQDRKDGSKGKDISPSPRKDQQGSVQIAGTVIKPNAPTAAELEAKWQQEAAEKKQREEEERKEKERLLEEKRLADEKQKAEEEERRKIEEAEQQLREELKTLEDYIHDANEKIQIKTELRGKNISSSENRPDDSFFSRLDSSLKKNTAFVKKLKNLTESQRDSLVKDFLSLNLSKYIGECAAGLAEAKLKMSDVSCGVILSSLFHQRYAEFSPALLESFQKFLLNKKDEKIPNPSKYRVDLRFFAELLSVRVFSQKEGLPILANQLSVLVNNDKDEHNNLSTISSFCKHCGDDYAGLVSRRIRELSEKHNQEIPKSGMLPPERQKACRNLLKDYYQTLCKHLTKDHKGLKALERHNLRMLQTKGELSTEKKELYENSLGAYQKLYINTATLSDLLDEEMPDLPEEDFKQDPEMAAFDVFNPLRNSEYQYDGDTSLFEDEETRTFYENLPDLKSFIPGILYKESEHGTSKDAITDTQDGLDEENLAVEDVEKEMETEKSLAEIEQQAQEELDTPLEEEEDLPPQVHINDEDDGETVSLMRSQFEAYLQSLPNCVNRELIDKAAIEFCMNFNTKSNRKKLVKGLFTVHRTRYDLLPFYSRYVATLYPCMPDVANDLAQFIKNDFKWHVRKKDQINIESKLKTVRFMGELVKFNMFPKSESLHCVKMLMFDFRHHNIEMACSLLEACGRYLYRSPESHHRTKVYLDVMMRKKTALHLDGRYITMIENAYYYSNPPDTPQMVQKERPPMHEYTRKLLYKDLSKTTTEKVLRQLRKLDWDNEVVAFYATKCLTTVWHVRYNSIHCVANTLAGLAPYHETVAIHVVDGVIEDIRIGMEINHPKYNQRRVSGVKYLGELYNYRMVESAVIFKTLYSFISFGVSLDESMPSPLDPPEHLFRLRLVCVLLDTCGQYFDKGSSKKKLDYFLVYFQRYYSFKRGNARWCETSPFPIDQMNMVKDTLEMIRPKLKMHENFEEASKAAEELGNEFKTKLAKALPKPETRDAGDSGQFMDPGLTTIHETDEMDELSQGYSQTPLTDDGPSTADSQTSTDGHTGSQPYEGDRRRTTAEEEEDVLESAGEEEMDDQVTVLSGGPKFVTSSEDDDFMAAFDKMMVDNIQARNSESLKVPQLDIAVPMHLKGQKKTFVPQQELGSINFVLMTRKGNKQQFSNLNVPISEEFAAKFKEREKVEKAEKERMKQVVLDIHERQEEEDYQEMIASLSRPATTNTNRERRVRYQHPKGAPDADLIFGSKKR